MPPPDGLKRHRPQVRAAPATPNDDASQMFQSVQAPEHGSPAAMISPVRAEVAHGARAKPGTVEVIGQQPDGVAVRVIRHMRELLVGPQPAGMAGERLARGVSPHPTLGQASASAVLRLAGVNRDCVQARAAPHRWRARGPYLEYGGPPPRVAFVLRVAGEVGKPASVRASAVSLRPRYISGLAGIVIIATVGAQMRGYDGLDTTGVSEPDRLT